MVKDYEELTFNNKLRERVKRLRNERGWSADYTAQMLGINLERYKKYESRSVLPHYLIPRFAAVMRVSVSFLLTGRDE